MISRTTTTLPTTQFTVGDGNWDSNRGVIQEIVLHTMDGTVEGANARFNTPNIQVSVHYGIGVDGTIYQWVDEDNVAYANGNYLVNQIAISIEHEDLGKPNDPRPDILYQKSAELCADICKFYDFPADNEHILLHKNVINTSVYPGGTACPDALDTDKIIAMANEILNPPVTPEVSNPTPVVPVEEPKPDQTDTNPVSNTPDQTISQPVEATPPVSGQAGKVPLVVPSPVSPSKQPILKIPDWLIQLIVKVLAVLGIEVKN